MKQKNLLKAKLTIDHFKIVFFCRKTKKGYVWYCNGGGCKNERVEKDSYKTLDEAKNGIVALYPPRWFNMKATWV